MSTEPKIYTKNYLDLYSSIVVSSGNGTKARLYDRDRDVQWSTSGQNNEASTGIITSIFQTPAAVPSAKTIDTVILLNHNTSDILIESSPDGSAWTTRSSNSGLLTTNDILSVASTSAAYWRMSSTHTNPTSLEKTVGELIYCSLLLDPGVDLDNYDVSYRQMAPEIPLADGSTHRTVVKWTESRSAKYDFNGRMSYLTFAQLEALRTLKEGGSAFYWQPESITRPQEIYYVNWTGPFHYRYITSYKLAGYQMDFQFKEV